MAQYGAKAGLAASAALLTIGIVAVVVGRGDAPTNLENSVEVSSTTSMATTSTVTVSTVPIEDGSEWEQIARSVVLIQAEGSRCGWIGSGSIVGDGSYVLTNQHVSGDGECSLSVWLTDSTAEAPTNYVRGEVVTADQELDLAVVRMVDASGQPFVDASRKPMKVSGATPKLGEKITILGYPGLGGSTITLTSGDFSGVDTSERFEYLKTTANMNPGVSGGAALNSEGELVGVPTAGRGAEIACDGRSDCIANGSTIGLLRPASLAANILARVGS